MNRKQQHELALLLMLVLSLATSGIWAAKIGGGGGGGGGMSLPTDTISTSEAAPLKIRGIGAQAGNGINLYQSSTGVPTWVGVCGGVEADCDITVKIDSGNFWELTDSSGNTIIRVTPGGAAMIDRLTYGANYHPLRSVWIGATSLVGDGTNCPATPTAVTINSGPKIYTFICGSGANGDLDFNIGMPPEWDGGSLLFEARTIQTAANTSAFNSDIKLQCRGAGETPSSTWGTAVAMDDAAVTGSNGEDHTASAAVTPAGTCAGGDDLYGRFSLDVTGTTTPEATLHIKGFMMWWAAKAGSS